MLVYVLQLEGGKFYVGKSQASSFSLSDFNASSSTWTARYTPLAVEKLIYDCDHFDEDKYTLKHMGEHGILNVRGGSFAAERLAPDDLYMLVKMIRSSLDTKLLRSNSFCLLCGSRAHSLEACSEQRLQLAGTAAEPVPVSAHEHEHAGEMGNGREAAEVGPPSSESQMLSPAKLLKKHMLDMQQQQEQQEQQQQQQQQGGDEEQPMDAAALVRQARDCEARIKELKKSKSSSAAVDVDKSTPALVAQQFVTLRGCYLALLAQPQSIVHAVSPALDVHSSLWKSCFYQQIEEYRKSMRKCLATIKHGGEEEEQRGARISTADTAHLERAKHHLARLVQSFGKFLSDGIVFYTELLLQVEAQQGRADSEQGRAGKDSSGGSSSSGSKKRERAHTTHKTGSSGGSGRGREELLHSVYRCLLYLGDLARYRAQNAAADSKDFTEAQRYYERASYVDPHSGNPHNQLAVLAGYGNSDCVAVYYYCRSVLTRHPFQGGHDNLSLLFAKIARTYRKLNISVSASASAAVPHGEDRSGDRAKMFLVRFVHLHGLLFDWTRSAYDNQQQQGQASDQQPLAAAACIPAAFDVEVFQTDLAALLEEYDALLASAAFGDALLTKLLVLCIFSVHRARVPGWPGTLGKPGEYPHARTVGESCALVFVYGFIQRTAARVEVLLADVNSVKRSFANKLIVILSIFGEWCVCHPEYLVASLLSSNGGARVNPALFSDAKLVAEEAEQRGGMRLAVAALKDLLSAGGGDLAGAGADGKAHGGESSGGKLWVPPNQKSNGSGAEAGRGRAPQESGRERGMSLREHVELRGFLPLADIIDKHSSALDPVASDAPLVLAEKPARERRQRGLCAFIRDWLLPCARREAAETDGRRLQAMQAAAAGGAKQQREKEKEKERRPRGPPAKPPASESVPTSGGSNTAFALDTAQYATSATTTTATATEEGGGSGGAGDFDEDDEFEEMVVYKPVFAKRVNPPPMATSPAAGEEEEAKTLPLTLQLDVGTANMQTDLAEMDLGMGMDMDMGGMGDVQGTQGIEWMSWGTGVDGDACQLQDMQDMQDTLPLSRVSSGGGGNWWDAGAADLGGDWRGGLGSLGSFAVGGMGGAEREGAGAGAAREAPPGLPPGLGGLVGPPPGLGDAHQQQDPVETSNPFFLR